MLKTRLFAIVILMGLFFIACNKEAESNSNIPNEEPFLYKSVNTFQSLEIGQLILNPKHRTGPNSIVPASFTNLPLTIWIPQGAPEPFPVVIFSHGGGTRITPGNSGVEWAQFLSKSGYAVIAMHHMKRATEDVIQNICQELGVNASDCDQSVYIPYYESTDRPQDAVAVMDSLSEIASMIGYDLDPNKIAIMGFSGGSNTTHYLAGGIRNPTFGRSVDPTYFSLIDTRPKAFLAMSTGTGIQGGWTAESLANIDKPFMCATGLGDLSSSLRAEFYDQLKGNDQYRLYINSPSAKHVTFSHEFVGTPEEQADQVVFHAWLEATNLAFLDGYVKDDTSALNWLQSENISNIINKKLVESSMFPSWSFR